MSGAGTKGDLEQFYNNLDREHEDLTNYIKHCDKIKWGKKEKEVKEICTKFIRYLETSKVLNVEKPKHDICILLNYWLYDKLTKIFGVENNLDNIRVAFGNFQRIWSIHYYYSSRINHNKCNPNFETDNHKDWENRKKLYDYYVDYNDLDYLAKFNDNECKYYRQIKDKISLYEYFEEECSPKKSNCPDFYNQCLPYNPKNVLHTLKCYNQIPEEKSPASAYSAKESSSHNPTQESQFRAVGSASRLQEDSANTEDTPSTSQSSDIKTKVANSVLGAAPVLFTATMLYRYTPLGPWIRKLRGINTNSMNAMDGFSPYTQETGDIFSDESANYISYQPI
ncbi:variable surface protein Vir14-like [Plasmodium vivax]|uniref:Variable surface protein Vir14-like n=1 Tax=Plasmodium vivax (strain Salvador I) TaxID=126793 RepID=A5KD32_PLAVS|nr:variable surface protein Vir14-like [Plasmodium vivax]EDL42737.1 variable surface protein Vir14-like [Plasmodium vivax]|eukprot:XP_001612530.1 variable surface protein Vir14-like [Plasmodium vivax Sal-1]